MFSMTKRRHIKVARFLVALIVETEKAWYCHNEETV